MKRKRQNMSRANQRLMEQEVWRTLISPFFPSNMDSYTTEKKAPELVPLPEPQKEEE